MINKKIIFILGSMGKGGAERVISILANHYAERGMEVHIITLLSDTCEYELSEKIKLKYIGKRDKARIFQTLIWLSGIREYIKQVNPDKIISFFARINVLSLIATRGLKKSIIISERNDPYSDGRSFILSLLTFILYPLSDKIVFQTHSSKTYFPKYLHSKSIVIPNPIRVSNKCIQNKDKKIVSVGRFTPQKNHQLLLEAFSKLVKEFPEYKLYIYGDGELRDEYNILIKNLGIEDNVFLPGIINNIHEEIKDSKMFVLSSNYEGLSNALLEAMMMGLVCISTNCSGIEEYIIHNENGFLVPINDVDCLYAQMKELIINEKLEEHIYYNSQKMSKRFSTEKVISMWDVIIGD